jgi:hypothetical protein
MGRSIEGTSAGVEGGAVNATGADGISCTGIAGTNNGIGRDTFHQSMAAAQSPAMNTNGSHGPCFDRFM